MKVFPSAALACCSLAYAPLLADEPLKRDGTVTVYSLSVGYNF